MIKLADDSLWHMELNPLLMSIVEGNKHTKTVAITDINQITKLITTSTWSAATFKDQTRNLDNFISTSIIGLDIDGGLTIEQACARLNGYKYVIAPTRSHLLEKNGKIDSRFRILVFLSATITDSTTFAATWQTLADIFPEADKACKDPSRQYFASMFISHVAEGEYYPVTHKTPTPPTRKLAAPKNNVIPNFVANFIEHGSDSWNATLYKAAKQLQENGFEYDEAVDIFSNMTNAQFSGQLDHNDYKTIKSAYSKPGKYGAHLNWPVMIQNKSGDYFPDPKNQDNFIYLFEEVLKLDIKYNELRGSIELGDLEFSDYDLSEMRMSCRNHGLGTSAEIIEDVVNHLAKKNSYHPFKQVVESVPWDGNDYILELYKTIEVDGEEKPFYFEYLKRWIIGIIAKVYKPGAQNNMLVFVGAQGAGKSLWFEKFNVANGVFNEGPIDPTSKDDKLKTTQMIIWSVSEIDAVTRKKDVSDIKAFLTNGVFDVRAPYDRFSQQRKSVASFAASVNEVLFLVDSTGNRRFLTIPVKSLNKTHAVDMQQVLAQGKVLFDSGVTWWFNRDEIALINDNNLEFTNKTKMEFLIEKLTQGEDWVNADEALNALGYKDNRGPQDYAAFGRCAKGIGIHSKRIVIDGAKKTLYGIDIGKTKTKAGL